MFSEVVCPNSNLSSLNTFLPNSRVLRSRRVSVMDVGVVGALEQIEVADAEVVAVLRAPLILGADGVAGAERLLDPHVGVHHVVGPAHLVAHVAVGRRRHDRLRVVGGVAFGRER